MYNWHKSAPFLAEKARCKAVFRVDLSDISAHASPGLRTSVPPVRIVRLGSRHEVFDKIGALSIISTPNKLIPKRWILFRHRKAPALVRSKLEEHLGIARRSEVAVHIHSLGFPLLAMAGAYPSPSPQVPRTTKPSSARYWERNERCWDALIRCLWKSERVSRPRC